MNIIFISLFYIVFTPVVLADIYKCEVDGVVTFSQMPCSDTAKKITIEIRKPNTPGIENDSHRQTLEDVNDYIEIKKIDREIKRQESKIKNYQKRMNQEIKRLEIRASYAANNLAGATYENALTTQMEAVTKKYNTLIEVANNKLERLLEEKNRVISDTSTALPSVNQ